jgi:hypothetical protein
LDAGRKHGTRCHAGFNFGGFNNYCDFLHIQLTRVQQQPLDICYLESRNYPRHRTCCFISSKCTRRVNMTHDDDAKQPTTMRENYVIRTELHFIWGSALLHTRTTTTATPPQLLNRCSKHPHYTPPHTTTHHTTLRAHNARERGIDRNHTRTPPTITQSHATTKCRNTPIECGSGCRVRNNLFQTK